MPNSVRNSAPVGQTSRQPACVQCLQTSERHQPADLLVRADCAGLRVELAQRLGVEHAGLRLRPGCPARAASSAGVGRRPAGRRRAGRTSASAGRPARLCSMKATCRQEFAPELAGVVVGHPRQPEGVPRAVRVVHRERVPLLAGHLAGLAADADRGVGEEARPAPGAPPRSRPPPGTSGSGPNSRFSGIAARSGPGSPS